MEEASVRTKMQSALDALISLISSIRTGRANPNLIQNFEVSVYGGAQKLRILELANVGAPDPQSIVIDPWDKSIIGEIKKGIEAANIGMNPVIDGEIIRISMPPMTTEDREKYVKLLSQKLEGGRVMIRKLRGDSMQEIKRNYEDKTITEDVRFGKEKKVQELTDEFVKKIEEAGEKKKKELLQI